MADSETRRSSLQTDQAGGGGTFADQSHSHQSTVTPFSPQFEDISDAEDDVRPAVENPTRDASCSVPSYCLPPAASSGVCPSVATSKFCTSSAVTVSLPFPPVVGWNSYPGFTSQTATLPTSACNVGQPVGRMPPWVDANSTGISVVNHLSPVISHSGSNGPIPTAEAVLPDVSSRQSFFGNRIVSSAGYPTNMLLPVKSEFSQVNASGFQTSSNTERYNGHATAESHIKAELPSSYAESRLRSSFPNGVEGSRNFFASQLPKSEAAMLSHSDHDTFAARHEDKNEDLKRNLVDAGEPANCDSTTPIKMEIGATSPSHRSPCRSPVSSVVPFLQSSSVESGIAVDSFPPSSDDVSSPIPNNLEPKVPPLRIVIPSKVSTSGSLSDGSNTSSTSRSGSVSLPYVVNRTHSADSDVLMTTVDAVHRCDSSPAVFASSDNDRSFAVKESLTNSELVPAKRRKIKHSSKVSVCVHSSGDQLLITVIVIWC